MSFAKQLIFKHVKCYEKRVFPEDPTKKCKNCNLFACYAFYKTQGCMLGILQRAQGQIVRVPDAHDGRLLPVKRHFYHRPSRPAALLIPTAPIVISPARAAWSLINPLLQHSITPIGAKPLSSRLAYSNSSVNQCRVQVADHAILTHYMPY